MNLDNLFEDLEAQFDGLLAGTKPKTVLEGSHLMRVWHRREQITQLAAPILGFDFVAGMVLGENSFRLIRLDTVQRIALQRLPKSGVPECRLVSVSALEFMERLPLPFSVRWQTLDDCLWSVATVMDLFGQTFAVEHQKSGGHQLLPIVSIAQLELFDVENFDRDSNRY